MHITQTIILGIVEGITEFLPISSTGHMILTSKILGLTQDDFLKSFEIAIQLGAILSVVVLYWKSSYLELFSYRACKPYNPSSFDPSHHRNKTLYRSTQDDSY